MNEFLAELKTEALNFFQNAKQAALNVFQNSVRAVEPVLQAEALAAMSQLKTLAINTVGMLAQSEFSNLTGGQKQTIAVGTVMQGAVAQGKQLLVGDAVQFVQAAYNALAEAKPAQ